jgi:hypothetical protein
MACFNQWSLGGCGCSPCYPCPLPAANLTANYNHPSFGTATGTLTYLGGGLWQTAFMTPSLGGACVQLTIGCSGGCTYYLTTSCPVNCPCPGGTSQTCYDHPANCSGFPTGHLLHSFTCSPLNIQIGSGLIPSLWTITP